MHAKHRQASDTCSSDVKNYLEGGRRKEEGGRSLPEPATQIPPTSLGMVMISDRVSSRWPTQPERTDAKFVSIPNSWSLRSVHERVQQFRRRKSPTHSNWKKHRSDSLTAFLERHRKHSSARFDQTPGSRWRHIPLKGISLKLSNPCRNEGDGALPRKKALGNIEAEMTHRGPSCSRPLLACIHNVTQRDISKKSRANISVAFSPHLTRRAHPKSCLPASIKQCKVSDGRVTGKNPRITSRQSLHQGPSRPSSDAQGPGNCWGSECGLDPPGHKPSTPRRLKEALGLDRGYSNLTSPRPTPWFCDTSDVPSKMGHGLAIPLWKTMCLIWVYAPLPDDSTGRSVIAIRGRAE
ncbi:hypothetical protein QBC44DRAFT_29632 [Cladorrhinum sp. PSN332]|nr:hypothetical protein QBC44DRAFT_29632 [Cladorrhinum sp. PSN332]